MTNQPKGEQAAGTPRSRPPKRATQIGVVTSSGRQKTIRVTVAYNVRHPKYGKYLRRETSLHVHDEKNECHNGDLVEVMQCRPISKTKCWRLLRILKKAPEQVTAAAAPEVAGVADVPGLEPAAAPSAEVQP